MRRIPITESAFPDGEEADEIIVFPCGNGWGAIYREEEISEGLGEGPCPLLAAADLVLEPYREGRR